MGFLLNKSRLVLITMFCRSNWWDFSRRLWYIRSEDRNPPTPHLDGQRNIAIRNKIQWRELAKLASWQEAAILKGLVCEAASATYSSSNQRAFTSMASILSTWAHYFFAALIELSQMTKKIWIFDNKVAHIQSAFVFAFKLFSDSNRKSWPCVNLWWSALLAPQRTEEVELEYCTYVRIFVFISFHSSFWGSKWFLVVWEVWE